MDMPEGFIEFDSDEDYFGEWAEYWQQEQPQAPGNAQQQIQPDGADKPLSA